MGNTAKPIDKSNRKNFFQKIWAWDKNKKFYQNARFWTIVFLVIAIGGAGSNSQSDTLNNNATTHGDTTSNNSNDSQSQKEKEQKQAEQRALEEAKKQENIANAVAVDYTDLFRNSDNYKGQYLRFTGKVLQTDSDNSYCRVATKKEKYGDYWYDNVIFVSPCIGDSKILEDDLLSLVVIGDGTYTYKTVLNANNELPKVQAVKIEITGHSE